MVLAAPGPLLTPPLSSSPPKTPHWSYSALILILSFCVYVSTLHIFLLCLFSYSGLILVLISFLFYPYCYSRCGRLSSYSLSREAALLVHIRPYFIDFIFRSQATFILGELSETILLFVDSGGSEVGHVPLDVRNC